MSDGKIKFQWSGIDKNGKRVSGVLSQTNVKEAYNELTKLGIEIINLQVASSSSVFERQLFKREKKVKQRDTLLFTRYLSTMLGAGLPVIQALEIVGNDQDNPAVHKMITHIKNNIASGVSLTESFKQYPDSFNDLYCNLISAGEKSGTLDKILGRLANYLEKIEAIRRKVKKALIYPVAILVVAFVVSLILLLFVVPQFEKMFTSFGAELPFFTRMVVHLSDFLRSYWWAVILVIFALIWIVKISKRRSETVLEWIDKGSLRIYVIGNVLKKSMIARFARTLSTTLEAGLPIVESMKSVANIMGNRIYTRGVLRICDDVASGRKLSVSMDESKLFPNMVIQMISVGEASGTLSVMLNKVADYYEEEVNYVVDNLSSLLEPLIMAVLGVIIGGFVIAMYLPIFKLGSIF